MSNLIYVEGFSEANLVSKLFQHIGRLFSLDSSTILEYNEIDYLKNCRSDSGIKPALNKDSYKIRQVSNKKIIIIRDIDDSVCYSTFKSEMDNFLKSENINNHFEIINSRPEIEFHYFENPDILKRVILKYVNERKSCNHVSFDHLKDSQNLNLLDYHSLKKILRNNDVAFSKSDFSERYFATLFSRLNSISISQRLEAKL